MQFDDPLRAELHRQVSRDAAGNFGRWAFEREIPFVEVAEAARLGCVISERVRAALERGQP